MVDGMKRFVPKTSRGARRSRSVAVCVWLLVLSVPGWSAANSVQEPDWFQGHPQGEQLLEECQLGMQRAEGGRPEEAIGHFNKILEAVPGHPLVLIQRGWTLLQLGSFAAAE